MKINYNTQTIVMTKAEAKAASIFGSPEYENLVSAKAAFPKFRIETRTVSKRPTEKGLTYEFMRGYIEKHDDNNKSIMKAFETLTATSADAKVLGKKAKSYPRVKQWFLETYDAFREFEDKRNDIILNVKTNPTEVSDKAFKVAS